MDEHQGEGGGMKEHGSGRVKTIKLGNINNV